MSESAVLQFDDVTKLGYPNLQPEYTLGNDVTGAFHDTEVADIGYAATNTIESSNPDEFGTFGYDIPSLFKTVSDDPEDKRIFAFTLCEDCTKRSKKCSVCKLNNSQASLQQMQELKLHRLLEGHLHGL